MEGKLYSTTEVAATLDVSSAYILKLVAQGKATPIRKVGRSWVFDQAELDRLRNRQKSKGGRPPKQK